MVRRWSLVLLLTLLLFGGSALIVQAEEVLPVGDLRAMAASASEYAETLTAATPDKFVQIFGELHRQWEIIEYPIADAYPHGYLELEQKFAALKQATTGAKSDQAIVAAALAGLAVEAVEVAAHLESNREGAGACGVCSRQACRTCAK